MRRSVFNSHCAEVVAFRAYPKKVDLHVEVTKQSLGIVIEREGWGEWVGDSLRPAGPLNAAGCFMPSGAGFLAVSLLYNDAI